MYLHLILPILSFCLAQGTKFILKNWGRKKIDWMNIFAYSDMPSGHTAVVISLMTIVGLTEGLDSAIFAISLVFAAIVIVDAIGLRNYLGYHGKTLNIMVKDLKEDDFLDDNYPKQLEKIGHTPLQVIIGAIIGAGVSLIGWSLLG